MPKKGSGPPKPIVPKFDLSKLKEELFELSISSKQFFNRQALATNRSLHPTARANLKSSQRRYLTKSVEPSSMGYQPEFSSSNIHESSKPSLKPLPLPNVQAEEPSRVTFRRQPVPMPSLPITRQSKSSETVDHLDPNSFIARLTQGLKLMVNRIPDSVSNKSMSVRRDDTEIQAAGSILLTSSAL